MTTALSENLAKLAKDNGVSQQAIIALAVGTLVKEFGVDPMAAINAVCGEGRAEAMVSDLYSELRAMGLH